MKTLHYLLPLLLLTSTSGVPVRYDQRQEGDLNVHAHLENFIIVLIPSSSVSLLDLIPLKKQNTLQAKPGNNEASNEEKYIIQGTGTKLSAPDFPAGKSPYKVDIDKADGEETGEKQVLIAHVPSALIANAQVKTEGEPVESTTVASSDEESSTKLTGTVPPAIEKVQYDVSAVNSDKKEHTAQKTQIKGDKKEEETTEVKEEKKEEQKTEVEDEKKDQKTEMKDNVKPAVNDEKKKEDVKLDEVPVIDTVPGKPPKAPKSIDFGLEAAKPRLQSVAEEETPRVGYPLRPKTYKFPTYRHEVVMDPPVGSEEYAMRLKMLRTGVDGCEPGEVMGDNGECLPAKFKQRSGNYFSSLSDDRLLPILQFGVSAANPEESD